MENIDVIEREEPMKILSSEAAADYLKCWPVPLQAPVKPLYIKGSYPVKRKSYRFKYSYIKNWLIPLDGPMSMDHVHFLLDCFVVSAGPVPLQLGRYHPRSDPEAFVPKLEDTWSVNSDDDENYWVKIVPSGKHVNKDAGPSSEILWPEDDGDTFENYFPRARPRAPFDQFDIINSDDSIVRELSEMRLVLERLLDSHESMDWDHPHGLRDVLDLLPDDTSLQEPHYPVGDWEFNECGVCFESQWLYRRVCCHFAACSTCLQSYYSVKVDDGEVKILCCNIECNAYVHRDEVSARLSAADKKKFQKLLILANQDSNTKTCPRCSHLTPKQKNEPNDTSITCPSCRLQWCFNCHAPWHGALSCKQFRKGDRLLRSWAKERNHGQQNAQKCPRCKIYIQRITGCDHMHCTRCKTDFCYKCGERFRYLKFFGDHYSKLSVFGCKYRFKADQPMQRKVIRGAVFGGKLIAAPVLGSLALCAGAVAVGISLFALPVYGGVRLYRHCEDRQAIKMVRRQPPSYHIPNVSLHISHSLP